MTRTSNPAAGRSAWSRAACAAAALAALVSTLAWSQPANEPLLTRAPAVRPNLLFVLDDSGSMDGSSVYARHFEVATGWCGDSNYSDRAPINNLLYYDSTKRYEPAFNNSGVQLANATVPNNADWNDFNIYLPKTGQNIPSLTTKEAICDSSRYDRIRVRDSDFRVNSTNQSANPLPTSAARTDCTGACTLAQEKQNITNWLTWHSTRLKAAKVGVSKAFASQPDTFRLGYTTIHVGNADGSGSGNPKLWGVKDYFLAKGSFYTWLNALDATGGTPLRKALDIAGQYYSRSDKNGPWAHSPWNTNSDGEAITDHLSCRRNFTILVTDGEWNSDASPTPGSQANVDGVNGPVIAHSDGVTKYQYKPRDADARSVGKADKSASGNATDWGNTLADVALYYWNRDLRTDLLNNASPGKQTDKPFWQNMTTFTAAFGPVGKLTAAQVAQARTGQINWTTVQPTNDSPETIDDLIHAAHNGGGEFLTLTDAASFANELGRVVDSIAGEQFSQAGVAASAVTLTAGTKKFVPYYTAGKWWGNVKMINLSADAATLGDETGVAWEVVATDAQGKPTGPAKIAPHASRAIYTWTPTSKGIPFTWANLSPSLVASSAANNTATLLAYGITSTIVDFLRGDRSNEGDLPKPFRVREAILGDIVNSTPVFIKNNSNFRYERLPAGTLGLDVYSAYMTSKAARTEGVLFIGANDGMVHGFREGTASTNGGSETFAYIPQGVFGNLHELANKSYGSSHRFFVDGPMSESDAYISAPNLSGSGNVNRWTNLVLGSAGAGGRSVFALDVTQPLNMTAKSVLWEVNHKSPGMADLGYVMNQVETGITASGEWVAIVGNGPYGNSGLSHLFILNLADGSLLKKMDTNADTGNGLGGVRVVRNEFGQIVGAYAGDLKGNVWRFDLSAGMTSSWPSSGQLLYTAKDVNNVAQPITATPGVMPRPDAMPGYMVIVGTGKLYDLADQSSAQTQAAYGLWDKAPFGGTVTFSGITSMSSLISVNVALDTSVSSTATSDTNPDGVTRYYKTTVSRTPNWTIDRGWFINYTLTSGQRTIFSVEPTKKVVRIDTIAPRSSQLSCALGTSQGFNYLVSPLTGTCRTNATFDTNNDGAFNESDSTACIYSTEADGEDVVLDVLNEAGQSSEFVDIQDSRGHIKARVDDPPVPVPTTSPGVTRSWRQLFMRPN
jgi:type IV pilus assembly protein PilY1